MDHASPELDADCRPTPLASLAADVVPAGEHFVRSHFGTPTIDASSYALEVGGLVRRPVRWTLPELRRISHISRHVTLECAGHRRTELDPPARGVPWGLGAVGHARWAGGQLADLLDIVRPLPEATHVVLIGADEGPVEGRDEPEPFARAIPLRDPVLREAVLAWEMNGRALLPEHGAPVRAIIPGWYAVSSIKWLVRIELIAGPFDGFFQAVDYRLLEAGDDPPGRELLEMPVHSILLDPADGATVAAGAATLRGIAWGGAGGVGRIEVQVDDAPWQDARLEPGPGLHAPSRFSLACDLAPGPHVVRTRAHDRRGGSQPDATPWNARGYGVNGVRASALEAR